MNKVILIGRLVKDPDIRYGQNNTAIARYTLAVDRRFKREGEATADFISVVALGKNGEFVEKYLRKGTKIAVTGRIQTGSYENKEGQRIYTTDVYVEEHEFVESRSASSSNDEGFVPANNGSNKPSADSFMQIPDGVDELPFA